MNRVIWTTLGLIAVLFGATASASPSRDTPCASLPRAVSAALARASIWSLVRLENLQSDDRALWEVHRPKACPGFATAHLGVGLGPAYAVALLRNTLRGIEEKVILLLMVGGRTQTRILVKPYPVANPAVVWRAAPGETQAWNGGPKIKVATDSIIFEQIEAHAEQFFYVHGRLKTVVTSD